MKFPVHSLLASSVLSFSFAVVHAAPIYIDGQATPLAACPTCVVGTHFKEGGDTWQPVDGERVRRFVARVKELR